jgi:hypothetical protein
MGKMVTVDPRAFALFKLWIAQDSDPLKKRRDANQAMVSSTTPSPAVHGLIGLKT